MGSHWYENEFLNPVQINDSFSKKGFALSLVWIARDFGTWKRRIGALFLWVESFLSLKVCIDCFHMTSRQPYWCSKTMKRRPCCCPKLILWELNSFIIQTLSFVPINLHRWWPREWKRSISDQLTTWFVNYVKEHTFRRISIAPGLETAAWRTDFCCTLLTVTSAPRSSNNWMVSTPPFSAALNRGVQRSRSGGSTAAPYVISRINCQMNWL